MIDMVMYQRRMAILAAIPPWSPTRDNDHRSADDLQRRLRQHKYMQIQDRAHQQLRTAAMKVLEQFKDKANEIENATQYNTTIAIGIDKQQPKAAVASAADASKKTPSDDTQYSTRSQVRRSLLAPTDSSAGRSSAMEELSTTTPGRRVSRRTSTATA